MHLIQPGLEKQQHEGDNKETPNLIALSIYMAAQIWLHDQNFKTSASAVSGKQDHRTPHRQTSVEGAMRTNTAPQGR